MSRNCSTVFAFTDNRFLSALWGVVLRDLPPPATCGKGGAVRLSRLAGRVPLPTLAPCSTRTASAHGESKTRPPAGRRLCVRRGGGAWGGFTRPRPRTLAHYAGSEGRREGRGEGGGEDGDGVGRGERGMGNPVGRKGRAGGEDGRNPKRKRGTGREGNGARMNALTRHAKNVPLPRKSVVGNRRGEVWNGKGLAIGAGPLEEGRTGEESMDGAGEIGPEGAEFFRVTGEGTNHHGGPVW